MKRTMLAILAISPLMLHAQAKSSAQPESTPVLQSKNIQPAVFATGTLAAAAAVVKPVRISTGVVPPVLIHSEPITRSETLTTDFLRNRTVTLKLTVDASGKPTNIRVIRSANPFTDQQVISSVSAYKYAPALLDGAAIPVDVNLSVNIE